MRYLLSYTLMLYNYNNPPTNHSKMRESPNKLMFPSQLFFSIVENLLKVYQYIIIDF